MGAKNNDSKRNDGCDIKPIGAIYLVDKKYLERKTKEALTNLGIEHVATVKAVFSDKGRVSIYAFIKTWSNIIQVSKVNAPKNLAHKIEGNGKTRLTDDGRELLEDFMAHNAKMGVKGNEYYIEFNVFKCIAAVLKVDRRTHGINIPETAKTKDGRDVMTVNVLELDSLNEEHNDEDGNNYNRFIEHLDSRDY